MGDKNEEKPSAPVYRLSGFDVRFPHQPYGVQLAFMSQVIKAIDHQENALLEAPTGCGKTLSLLCSALAWQTAQKQKKAAAAAAAAETKPGGCLAAVKPEQAAADGHSSEVDDPAEAAEEIVVPKIYYATRTHSQIAQVVRELKRTAYKPRMAVLGSRPHYCINKRALNSSRGVDGECEELMKDYGCRFQKNARTLMHSMVQVHDIEDLHRIGNRLKACPYFAARHLAETAELIFCPYSYLLDPNIRRASKIEAADSILIFDEAHNIEDQAREAGSTELDIATMMAARDSLRLAATMSSEGDAYMPLAEAMATVVDWLAGVAESSTSFKSTGFERFEQIWTGQQMLSALTELGLEPQAVEHLWACYSAARQAEEKAGFNTEGDAAHEPVSETVKNPGAGGAALGCVSQLLTTLRLLFGTYTEAPPPPPDQLLQTAAAAGTGSAAAAAAAAHSSAAGAGAGSGIGGNSRQTGQKPAQMAGSGHCVADYRMVVQKWVPREGHKFRGRGRQAQSSGAVSGQWGVALCLWCLNPAVVFRSLSEVARSVLLTSGTLSPLDSFGGELGLKFHLTLEARHVVDMNRQVFARVVSHGPEGRLLNATFKEADKAEYQDSLGQLLLQVAASVPDGVLLFLPSYSLMDKLRERWTATGLWAQLERLKHIVPEPRQAGADFDKAIEEYYSAVRSGRGGLFVAVCRGKASEGIDFADGNARCVLVVGIPFPNVKDTKVGLKKDYNNAASTAASHQGQQQRQQQAYGSSGGWQRPQGNAALSPPPRLLSGDQWYSQQAFRALNQAIGRCIRHKLDYGAILLVDERFRQPRNQGSLSKWVRGNISTAASTPALLADLRRFFEGLAADPPGGTAPALQQQQQQQLVKPGLELQVPFNSKPGYEAAEAGQAVQKPGYEAAAGVISTDDASGKVAAQQAGQKGRSAGGTGDLCWRQPTPQRLQQQQQAKAGHRVSGPMDSFLVKQATSTPGHQQQELHVRLQQEQVQPHQQVKQEQDTHTSANPGQQAAGPLVVKHEQQHQQHQQKDQHQHQPESLAEAGASADEPCRHFRGSAVGSAGGACMAVTGCQVPATSQQQWQQQQQPRPLSAGRQQRMAPPQWQQPRQQQQQQQRQLQPVSCMAAVINGSCCSTQQQQQQAQGGGPPYASAADDHAQLTCHSTKTGQQPMAAAAPLVAAGAAPAGNTAAMPAGGAVPAAAAPDSAGQSSSAVDAEASAAGVASSSPPAPQLVAPKAGVAVQPAQHAGRRGLTQLSQELGLGLPLLQQWVSSDYADMKHYLISRGTPAAGQHGHSLEQLASFGIMGSFELAFSVCQQQQQHGHVRVAASLSSFWPMWHSHLPAGLLVVAAAAGQLPGHHVARLQGQGLEGPWLRQLAQRQLQHNLHDMADAYDQMLDDVLLAQQQQLWQQQHNQQLYQQQQQQHGGNRQQWPQAWPGVQQQRQQQQQQQHQQQQYQYQQQHQYQHQHQHQHQYQQQQGQQQQQQKQQQQHQGTGQPLQQQQQGWHGGIAAGMAPAGNHTAAGTAGQPAVSSKIALPMLQLSQTARQPKRNAWRSEKSQLAAQKRNKLNNQAVARPAGPQEQATVSKVLDDEISDDDDFV